MTTNVEEGLENRRKLNRVKNSSIISEEMITNLKDENRKSLRKEIWKIKIVIHSIKICRHFIKYCYNIFSCCIIC